jgi:hypothetical protein
LLVLDFRGHACLFACFCLRLLVCFRFYFLGDGFELRGSALSIFFHI